jgi:hypothetical protein
MSSRTVTKRDESALRALTSNHTQTVLRALTSNHTQTVLG